MLLNTIALLLCSGTVESGLLVGAGKEGPLPAVQWAGPRSGIATARFVCIEDREAWAELWEAHAAGCADRAHQGWVMAPEVDFDCYMVIGAFAGARDTTNGATVHEVEVRADALVVRYDWIQFQTATGFGENEPEPDHSGTPYGLWLVERFDGQVVLEEDKRSLIDAEPEWRETHRFGVTGAR